MYAADEVLATLAFLWETREGARNKRPDQCEGFRVRAEFSARRIPVNRCSPEFALEAAERAPRAMELSRSSVPFCDLNRRLGPLIAGHIARHLNDRLRGTIIIDEVASCASQSRVKGFSERHIARVAGERRAHPTGHVRVSDADIRIRKPERAAGSRRAK
jgi:hypothetical protein